MAWNRTTTPTTKHTCNDGSGPAFGRKTPGCPRCDELLAGAAPVKWAPSRAEQDRIDSAYRRLHPHDCKASGCSIVCTNGEW